MTAFVRLKFRLPQVFMGCPPDCSELVLCICYIMDIFRKGGRNAREEIMMSIPATTDQNYDLSIMASLAPDPDKQ